MAGEAARQPREQDVRVVATQIRRKPRPFLEVTRRCRYDFQQIILTAPLQRRGDRWDVFPTVFWLTCPLLHRDISRLEAEGGIREYEELIAADPESAQRMVAAHRSSAALRMCILAV